MLQSVKPLHQDITLHIPDVATAQREYDAIADQCPATHDEAYLDPVKYRLRVEWIDKKVHAKTRLAMALGIASYGWKQNGEMVQVQSQVKRRQARKSIADLVACFQKKILIMARTTPRSGVWISARNKAYSYGRQIRERCQEEHVALPVLPPVPVLPPGA